MRFHEGVSLGPYRLLDQLGRGGMATVYRAFHPALDRTVAIKILPEFFAEDPAYQERFQHEARAVARLKHPNILQVFDFATDDGVAYIVMEVVEGGTLADWVGAPMPLRDVLDILEPIADALDYAHTRGVLHRDIKPTNILLRKDGSPVIADFGLSKLADSERRLTATGIVMGTAEYMSPEQASDQAIGSASDLYSLAVVTYEMLTGRVPFEGESAGRILLSHLTQPVPSASELQGPLLAHVDGVLQRGLAKDPHDRYQSAVAFARALKPAAWLTAAKLDEPAAPEPPPHLPSRRKPPVVLVVDDQAANRELIKACLNEVDCEVRTADDGFSALTSIEDSRPDLVLLDVQMPGMGGYEVCERIRRMEKGALLPVVMITALDSATDRVRAITSGADDFLSKPVDRIELVARVRSALRLKRVYDSLERAEAVVFSLAAAVEARDPYTEAHTQRVADYARRVGARMGLPPDELDALYRAGIVHDIGKIGVPDRILLKPGALDLEEERRMHLHTLIGENIVAPLQSARDLLPVIRHHHECFDGSGYPDQLAGDQIPLLARIVSVCDAYDALTNDRPYRRAQSTDEAVTVLRRGAGRQWDPRIVQLVIEEAQSSTSRAAAS